MTHTFLVELTDEVKGYEDSVDYLERVYGAEEFDLAEHDKQVRADQKKEDNGFFNFDNVVKIEKSKYYQQGARGFAEWLLKHPLLNGFDEEYFYTIRDFQMTIDEVLAEWQKEAESEQKKTCFDCKYHFMSDFYLECNKHERINCDEICIDFELKEQKND